MIARTIWTEDDDHNRAAALDRLDAEPKADEQAAAHAALELDLTCPEAHLILADAAQNADDALPHFCRALVGAARLLLPEDLMHGDFTALPETATYLDALLDTATILHHRSDPDALALLLLHLTLDTEDHANARYLLLARLVLIDDDETARALLKHYPEDRGPEWAYTRVLLAYRAGRTDDYEGRRALQHARAADPHVAAALAPVQSSETLDVARDRAAAYADLFRPAWSDAAIAWLNATI